MMRVISAVVVLVLCHCVVAYQARNDSVIPCKWTMWKQCDSSWANIRLGTSSTNTICSAGCAMSSVAMALQSHGIHVNGGTTDPKTLNSWLIGHGGYVDQDLLVWASVSGLGKVHMVSYTQSLSISKLQTYLKSCMAVVANVRDGTHWVLLTGWQDSNPNVFYVNDPGFNDATYDYSTMINFVVYSF